MNADEYLRADVGKIISAQLVEIAILRSTNDQLRAENDQLRGQLAKAAVNGAAPAGLDERAS